MKFAAWIHRLKHPTAGDRPSTDPEYRNYERAHHEDQLQSHEGFEEFAHDVLVELPPEGPRNAD